MLSLSRVLWALSLVFSDKQKLHIILFNIYYLKRNW